MRHTLYIIKEKRKSYILGYPASCVSRANWSSTQALAAKRARSPSGRECVRGRVTRFLDNKGDNLVPRVLTPLGLWGYLDNSPPRKLAPDYSPLIFRQLDSPQSLDD